MLRHCFAVSLVIVACAHELAWGHGFSLFLVGNSIQAASSDSNISNNPHLFFTEEFENDGLGGLATDHGGAGFSGFGSGKTLSFEVVTKLLYSNGGVAEPVAGPLTMEIANQFALQPPVNVTGGSLPSPATISISGNTDHELLWTLSGGAIPTGVYGVGYVVKGHPTSTPSTPYDPSPTLVAMFITPNFTLGNVNDPNSPFNLATSAIYNKALGIPEPSTLVLAALAGVAMLAARLRRLPPCAASMALSIACLASPAFGHGIPTELAVDANNKLFASQLVSYTPADSVIAGNPVAVPERLRGTTSFTAVESLKPITFTMEATGNI